ncbi:hypothetical protein L209DRAFT_777008 [Thermothelomyces heterothallicus CBS 203.75]
MDIQQPHSQPPLGRYEPNHASEHSHNGDHTLNSSTLPYRPRPDAPETTYPNQQPYPGSEPSKPTSYMGPPPHPSGPTQGPLNTSSSTLYNLNDTTSSAQHLAHVSPQPIPGPGLDSKSEPPSVPGPDAAASTTTYPPPNHYGHATASPPAAPADAVPNAITTAAAAGTNAATDIRAGRASAESALHELLAARRQRLMVHRVDGAGGSGHVAGGESDLAAEVEWKVRSQTGLVLFGLRGLQERVGTVLARAEGERWRRWGVGGVIASIIPLVKRLFRRRRGEDDDSSNRTEYAFKKSRNLVSRILATTNRPGLGTVAFFVFAVLYIFQNEVTLRVARTVSKRLKRLAAKVEDGREELTEHDVKVLQGWRWRVLAWKFQLSPIIV